MKVITKASEIDNTLVSMMKKYKRYHIATAWASLDSKASAELLNNKECIKKMIVGTHFHQTHPDFIEKFINSERVKFILKTNGVYHPKVYLFSNAEDDWECIVGSANFTFSALTKNEEIVVHIKSTDSNSINIYKTLMSAIEKYWDDAKSMSQQEYCNYKNIWNKNKRHLKVLERKPLVESQILFLNWSEYFERIKNDALNSFKERIEVLVLAQQYFKENDHFLELSEIHRKEIAGIATKNQTNTNIDWAWFGSMVGAGKFKNRINTNDTFISNALDKIPLQGKVYKPHYNSFVDLFKQAFPDGGAGVGVASRLLAMKRPDYFICLNNKNRLKLCDNFDIKKTVTFEEYWDDVIERIIDSVWWSSERPTNDIEAEVWSGRVAMLDVMFYKEE